MITNYTELKTAVLGWVNDSQASGKETDFITLAEAEISADLMVQRMNQEQAVSVLAGAEFVSLPQALIDPMSFQVVGARNPDIVITTKERLNRMKAGVEGYDPQRFYGALVGDVLQVFPALPAGSVTVFGKFAVPSLSDAAPTNWLLASFPNVYLFGAIREAGAYLRDADMIAWADARYKQALAKVNASYVYRGQMAASTVYGVR